jgi:hypothetical protein
VAALAILVLALQEPPSFGKDERLVAAYYRPGEAESVRAQLLEMAKAGIDVVLPAAASDAALAAFGPALDELEKERKDLPRVGLLLETGADPARAAARFRAAVAARHAARVDGRPLCWLAPAGPGGKAAAVRESLSQELGAVPFLVADVSWADPQADRAFSFGAQEGTPRDLPVVSVGPGRDREEGRFYDRAWAAATRLESRMVVVESWNGWPEGSGVAESAEHGRKYLEATARHARKFRNGEKVATPKGKWTGAGKALFTTKYNPHEQGLRPVPHPEGLFEAVQLRGIAVLATKGNKEGERRFLSFDVDDSFSFFEKRSFEVEIEFFDAGEGSFRVEYDSADRALAPEQRPFRSAGEKGFGSTSEWRTEKFDLPDALFGNRQPGGADFRIVLEKRGIVVRRVALLPR